MIYPSIDEITKGKYNRYTLVIATAKCARIVTDEYVEQRELAEKVLANNKDSDKTIASMIKREIRDEKAVKTAIKRLYSGEFAITEMPEQVDKKIAAEALRIEEEAAAREAAAAAALKENAEGAEVSAAEVSAAEVSAAVSAAMAAASEKADEEASEEASEEETEKE